MFIEEFNWMELISRLVFWKEFRRNFRKLLPGMFAVEAAGAYGHTNTIYSVTPALDGVTPAQKHETPPQHHPPLEVSVYLAAVTNPSKRARLEQE